MFSFYIVISIKLLVGFIILLIYLNISGKKRMTEMSPLNFIGNLFIGGTIGGAIYSNVPIYQYIIVLVISLGVLYIIEYLAVKISFFKEASIGHPLPIIKDGNFLVDVINDPKHKINILNIARQLRLRGIYSFDDIYYAQIETNGEITVIQNKDHLPTWILINNGQIMKYELQEIGKNEEWLQEEIKRKGIQDINKIFVAQYYKKKIIFVLQDGTKIE